MLNQVQHDNRGSRCVILDLVMNLFQYHFRIWGGHVNLKDTYIRKMD